MHEKRSSLGNHSSPANDNPAALGLKPGEFGMFISAPRLNYLGLPVQLGTAYKGQGSQVCCCDLLEALKTERKCPHYHPFMAMPVAFV